MRKGSRHRGIEPCDIKPLLWIVGLKVKGVIFRMARFNAVSKEGFDP